jgi:argininosuccinate lyase
MQTEIGPKLWEKGYRIAPLIEAYQAAGNSAIDAQIARYDIWGSMAHVATLFAAGILDAAEATSLHAALRELLVRAEAGALAPLIAQEDVHTAIESELVAALGDTGKKVHTGRSRNDQVLVALRLCAKERINQVALALLETATSLTACAQRYEWVPLPGYTHMQRAMLSSVGLWASAHATALLDDCVALTAAYALNDQCPLGSGAAYGAPLPLDRALTARLLGFARAQPNVLAAANGRGKGEAAVVQALALIMLDLSKFAQDVLLFTTSEFAFLRVPQELCDGSSMMPHKRNLSALELVRARAQTVIALQGQMLATLAGLPSGYNMDYQETKAPFLEALHICQESLAVVALFAAHLSVDEARARAACSADLFATDRALDLARAGVPFRDAYRRVALADAPPAQEDLVQRLRARTSMGASGNLGLDDLMARINHEHATWAQRQHAFAAPLADLVTDPLALASTAPTVPAEIVLGI